MNRRGTWIACLALAGVAAAQEPPADCGTAVVAEPAAERFWVRGEYVLWATTTPEGLREARQATASPLYNAALELTGTGQDDFAQAAMRGRGGFRLTAGLWLDADRVLGLEASALYLSRGPTTTPLDDPSQFGPVFAGIGVPGFTGQGGGTIIVPFGAANLVAGSLRFDLGDQTFLDLQGLGRLRLYGSECVSLDGLLGCRRLVYKETLGIQVQATALAAPLVAGSSVAAGASVESEAEFRGALIGFDWSAGFGGWEVGVRPSVTVARVENRVNRSAFARATAPGVGTVDLVPGPLLLPGNLTRYTSSEWTALPEVDLRLARSFGEHVRLVFGASILVLPSMARATGQTDLGLPVSGIVPGLNGVPLAAVVPPPTDTLILGTASIGLEFRY
jgi:hypothetical protein